MNDGLLIEDLENGRQKRRWARGVDPPYEGSFEDTTIIVSFSHNLSPETKKASLLLAHLQCSSLTSPVRSVPEDTSSSQIK